MRARTTILCAVIAVVGNACSDRGNPIAAPEASWPDQAFSLLAGNAPSVYGQAIIGGGIQSTAFHAQIDADGSVSGTFESKNLGQACGGIRTDPDCHVRVHAAIDCLVVDGDEAVLGGLITQIIAGEKVPDYPGLAVGQRFWAKVRDNGEGIGAQPDEFSDWFIDIGGIGGTTTTITECAPYPVVEFPWFHPGLLPIERGNIRVL